MSKKETENISNGEFRIEKKKKLKNKKVSTRCATNEEIVSYCMNNNLMYALMLWLEIDLGISILRSGIIKSYKTALGTDRYYFVSLDPNKKTLIKDVDMSAQDYKEYLQTLTTELCVYLTESESKPVSARKMFGRYVYAKQNGKKLKDIDMEAFIYHIKRFEDKKNENIKREGGA